MPAETHDQSFCHDLEFHCDECWRLVRSPCYPGNSDRGAHQPPVRRECLSRHGATLRALASAIRAGCLPGQQLLQAIAVSRRFKLLELTDGKWCGARITARFPPWTQDHCRFRLAAGCCFVSSDPYTRRYDLDSIAASCAPRGARVRCWRSAAQPGDSRAPGPSRLNLEGWRVPQTSSLLFLRGLRPALCFLPGR